MRAVIAGGGTGGHLFPGLALAAEIRKREKENEVLFVGTRKGLEERVVPKEGYDIRFIRAEGFVNRGMTRAVRSLLRMPGSLWESRRILDAFDPHVAIGVGGYASGPVVAMASWMGFPTLIHEQNAVPGLTNRLLGRMVDQIAVTYPDTRAWFRKEKTMLTGNPVRGHITGSSRLRARAVLGLDPDRFTLLVIGGSRGARSLNETVTRTLEQDEVLRDRIQLIHQTGDADEEKVKDAYRRAGVKGIVAAFLYAMDHAYAAADLVLCRAGASTLSELAACGKAAILVPYPHAAGNHQEANGRNLVDMGACRMILDADLSPGTLGPELSGLMETPESIREMEKVSRTVGRPDAARKVVDLVYGLCRKKGVL